MQIDTVVSGVDFEGSGLASARWVARNLSPERVILVNALHLPKPPGFLTGLWGDEEQLLISARSGAEARLAEFAAQFERETGVHAEHRVRVGAPAQQIGIVANVLEADLVVVGPHASRKGRWSLLGSTASRLLHDSRLPTLVGRGALRDPPANILGTVDESSIAAGVLGWTKDLSEHLGIDPTLLHVLEYPLEAHLRAIEPPRGSQALETELEDHVKAWLSETVEEANLPAGTRLRVALGEPAFEILAAAERYAIDLIVMGTRGVGAIGRALVGSVADAVLRRASCPVLALPTPGEATGSRADERTQAA